MVEAPVPPLATGRTPITWPAALVRLTLDQMPAPFQNVLVAALIPPFGRLAGKFPAVLAMGRFVALARSTEAGVPRIGATRVFT